MTGTNRLTGFAGWLRHATSNSPLLCRLSIHRRLTVCFLFVIVLMLVGEGALLRQLHLIRAQAKRLDGLTEELIEVQRVHNSLTSIYDRLGVSAQFEDSVRLLKEWDTLRTGINRACAAVTSGCNPSFGRIGGLGGRASSAGEATPAARIPEF